MRNRTLRLSIVLAIVAGVAHWSEPQAKAIELLDAIVRNIGRATEQAERQIDQTWGHYVGPIEDAYVADDLETLDRLLQQASWELDVAVRHHEKQVANIGKGAVSIELLEPVREGATQTVYEYAVDTWFDLVDAAGGTEIVLDPGGGGRGNSPRW